MSFVSGYNYGNVRNKAAVRRGEREIQKHYEELRKQQAAQKDSEPKTTIRLGGVEIVKDQILSYANYKHKGATVFDIRFKNGMAVQYMDQYDKKMPEGRFNAPGRIFVNGSDLTLYNITNGSVTGTEKQENIKLFICQNVNVDGKGGNDTYFSSQDIEFSNNSYQMHAGNHYKKEDFKGYSNLSLRDIVDTESSILYTDANYSFRDNKEHKNEFLEKENKFYASTNEATQEQRYRNYSFEITDLPEVKPVNDIKDDVIKRSNESMAEYRNKKLYKPLKELVEDLIKVTLGFNPTNHISPVIMATNLHITKAIDKEIAENEKE